GGGPRLAMADVVGKLKSWQRLHGLPRCRLSARQRHIWYNPRRTHLHYLEHHLVYREISDGNFAFGSRTHMHTSWQRISATYAPNTLQPPRWSRESVTSNLVRSV